MIYIETLHVMDLTQFTISLISLYIQSEKCHIAYDVTLWVQAMRFD